MTPYVRPFRRGLLLAMLLAMGPVIPAASPSKPTGRIVFSSNRSGAWCIHVMDADGGRMRQLTRGKAGEQDVDPVFSPDGRSVLFTSTRAGRVGIWRVGVEGGEPERICDGDQAEWSPDGKRIVLRRSERILTRHLATGEERTITSPGWPHCSGPSWSPDGKTIAFACRWEGGNGIYLVAAAGGTPRKLYDEKGACEPHWAPDGERIVYETEAHIWTIRPDGTRNRPITYYGGVQRFGRFSPDGKWIVFCQGASERGPWEIYVVGSEGGAPRKLTSGASDMYPHWVRP